MKVSFCKYFFPFGEFSVINRMLVCCGDVLRRSKFTTGSFRRSVFGILEVTVSAYIDRNPI